MPEFHVLGRLPEFTRTIRFRFGMWVAGLLIVSLALFGAILYGSLSRKLFSALDDSLRLGAQTAIAAMNIENGRVVISDGSLGEIATVLGERGFSLRLLDYVDGKVISYGAFRTVADRPNPESPGVMQSAHYRYEHVNGKGRLRVYAAPVTDGGKVLGMLEVAGSTAPVKDTLSHVLSILALLSPLFAIAAALGGYFLAVRALAPIDRLTATARTLTAESLSTRLSLRATNRDEVGRLAKTFEEMVARLNRSFQREQQFASDLSHELRTPLTAMQAIVGHLLERERTPDERRSALADLSAELSRLRALTEALLADVRSGGDPGTESVDLETLARDVVESMTPLAAQKGITVAFESGEPVVVHGDSDRLVRLLVNVVDNAIKYTVHGSVRVKISREHPNTACVEVSDTGCGISKDELPFIFNRFYRADRSRSVPGSGLGLAIALRIARSMGGDIVATSTVGAGSSFQIRLPAPQGG